MDANKPMVTADGFLENHFFFLPTVFNCFGHFCQPSRKMSPLAKASSILPDQNEVGKGFMVMKASDYIFEGGNFIKSKSDDTPKTLQTEPSLPTPVRYLFIILFLKELCQFVFCLLQLGSIACQFLCGSKIHIIP